MNIEECITKLLPQMKIDKQYLWEHPEEEFKEVETSAYIVKRLQEMGYEDIKTNIAKTGIVAELEGKQPGECILFRSDMDAVVMDANHRTKHTCGHDAHMTILLGLAQLLIDHKDELKGHVKLLFQPAEEGNGGAKPMIESGVLKSPDVDKVFAIHVWSEVDEGKIGIKEGPVMASTNPFNIKVIGKGGHAAIPEKCINPIYIANEISRKIQSMANNSSNLNEIAVVGITAINGGSTNNVIPDEVSLKGICRTFNNDLSKKIFEDIKNTSKNIAESMNGDVEVKPVLFYPAVINTKKEADEVIKIAKEIVGEENVVTDYKTMTSEDFSYFLQEKPGAFIFIGNRGENIASQHNENYFVSEKAILVGVQIEYEIARRYLCF